MTADGTANRNRSATASERLLHFGKVVIILMSLNDHKSNKNLIKRLLFMDQPPLPFVVHVAFKVMRKTLRQLQMLVRCMKPCQSFSGCLV